MAQPGAIPHANVRVPPPLIYVAGFAVGWLVHRRSALRILGADHRDVRLILGALCVVLWLGLFASAFGRFRSARTSMVPIVPATAIVTDGPYRVTRNPMYVSLAALYAGAALFMNSWWPLALLPLVLIVVDRTVIAREERYLRSAFPVEYAAYCARVRRWI
jgi:protein-S-isoprenylcysteine O-methyltransferase Ste14